MERDGDDDALYEPERDDVDEEVSNVREHATDHMWRLFETSAVAIAQLYKDRQQFTPAISWQSFQESARSVTALYQDSVELHRKALELGIQLGHRKRNKELVAWAKRRRRHVKRDELLAVLDGRPTPVSSVSRFDAPLVSTGPIHLPSAEDPGLFSVSESLSVTSLPDVTQCVPQTSCPAHCVSVQPSSPATGSPLGGYNRRKGFAQHFPCETPSFNIRDSLSHEAAFARALLTGRKRLAGSDVSMDYSSPKRGKLA